jgi:hypothetical protein
MAQIPCFLCGNQLETRTDKNKKPYFICDPCGLQAFIRRNRGIQKLGEYVLASSKHQQKIKAHEEKLGEIRGILAEINGVKEEIKKLDQEIGFFFPDEDKRAAQQALKNRLSHLIKQLDAISQGHPPQR